MSLCVHVRHLTHCAGCHAGQLYMHACHSADRVAYNTIALPFHLQLCSGTGKTIAFGLPVIQHLGRFADNSEGRTSVR